MSDDLQDTIRGIVDSHVGPCVASDPHGETRRSAWIGTLTENLFAAFQQRIAAERAADLEQAVDALEAELSTVFREYHGRPPHEIVEKYCRRAIRALIGQPSVLEAHDTALIRRVEEKCQRDYGAMLDAALAKARLEEHERTCKDCCEDYRCGRAAELLERHAVGRKEQATVADAAGCAERGT